MKKYLNLLCIEPEKIKTPIIILCAASLISYVFSLFGIKFIKSLFFIVVVCVFIYIFIKNTKKFKFMFFFLISLFILYFIFKNKIIYILSDFVKHSSIKFALTDYIFKTFGIYDFNDLFLYKSPGGAIYSGNLIVTGAANIFKIYPQYENVSKYLTFQYFLLFSSLALCTLLCIKQRNTTLCVVMATSFLTGNITPILVYLLFTQPINYLILMLFGCVLNIAAVVLNVKIGFVNNPSIFELLILNENKIYSFFVCLLVYCVSLYVFFVVNKRKL